VGVRKDDGVGDWLWSWHIWVTDFDAANDGVVYPTSAQTGMDRNLGAKNKTPGSAGALGLMYQFGRKDPFPGASATATGTTTRAATTLASWLTETPDIGGTFAYTTQHPTVFVTAFLTTSSSKTAYNLGSWFKDAENGVNPAAWAWGQTTTKTINDPCPKGWKVPDNTNGTANQTWSGFTAANWIYDSTNNGRTLGGADWWPMAGWLNPFTGVPANVGTNIYMMSTRAGTAGMTDVPEGTGTNSTCFGLSATSSAITLRAGTIRQASAAPVRCIRFIADDN
jgi:hypothetical protein